MQELPERKGCDVRTPYSQDPHTIWTSPSSPNLTEEADPNRRLSKQRRCGRDTVQFLPKPPRMVPQIELRPPQYCYMTQPAHCALRLGALPHQPATHPGAPPTTATYSNPETAPATNSQRKGRATAGARNELHETVRQDCKRMLRYFHKRHKHRYHVLTVRAWT